MKNIVVASMIVFMSLVTSNSDAASACKGLAKSQCGAKTTCSWVAGYARSDGAKVSSHCRAKGGSASKKSSKSKAASAKTKEKGTSSKKVSKESTGKKTKKSANKKIEKKKSGKKKSSSSKKSSKKTS